MSEYLRKEVTDPALLDYEDIVLKSYSTEDEWYQFYNNYARCKGFSIRKSKVRYDINGDIYYRLFVCSREGSREAKYLDRMDRVYKERPLSRCGCDASLEICYDFRAGRWFVYGFMDIHSHELAGPDEVPFLRSQRNIDEIQMEEIQILAQCGIPKHKIMDYMEYRDGGYENVGFVRKDIYNKLCRMSRMRIEEGDAQTVLNMMKERKQQDVDFFYLKKTNNEGHLTHLFWTDSQSRIDFEAFGDVLIFDSTYRTNKYGMPFIPFIGINHHRRTSIFGCGVVSNEMSTSYIWLLQAFKMAMCQKEPLSIITDGDSAMREAIISEFPGVKHRLCCWHVGKNLYDNIKSCSVRAGFHDLMSNTYTIEQFEFKWKMLLASKLGVKPKKWLMKMHDKRCLWAETYLHGYTFLGIRSTQRSESVNANLRRYLNFGMTLVDMVHHYDRCVSRARRNEAEDDCKAFQFTPYLKTCMRNLESYIADIYTPPIFELIQNDMQRVKNYRIIAQNSFDGSHKFVVVSHSESELCRVVCCEWKNDKLVNISCDCLKLQTIGIPCCHMLSVMNHLQLTSIPESCVWHWWTQNVKAGFASDRHGTMNVVTKYADRYQKLVKLAKKTCYHAAKSDKQYYELVDLLTSRIGSMEVQENDDSEAYSDYNSVEENIIEVDEGDVANVLDPNRVKTKGAPKKRLKSYNEKRRNKCGICNQEGHNIRTCPNSMNEKSPMAVDVEDEQIMQDMAGHGKN